MAFIRLNFSPVGSQSRRGASPQIFTYQTADAIATVVASGYFPNTGGANGMLGNFSPNDVIITTYLTGGTPLSQINFIDNDGSDGNAITVRSDNIGPSS